MLPRTKKYVLQGAVVSLVLALVMTSLIILTPANTQASGDSWLTGWNYRQSVTVSSASGAGTGYQVLIHLRYGSGTNAAETYESIPTSSIYLNSHARSDFGDVRFTSSDGKTLQSYYVESSTTSTDAYVWVRLTDDISSASSQVYIYYGNASATSASNGAATFPKFFCDWDSSTTLSNYLTTTIGSCYVSGDHLFIGARTAASKGLSVSTFSAGSSVRQSVNFETNAANQGENWGFSASDDSSQIMAYATGGSAADIRCSNAGTKTDQSTTISSGAGISEISWASTAVHFRWNGVDYTNSPITTNIPTVAIPLIYFTPSAGQWSVYWTFVRSYVVTEPTQGSYVSESAPSSFVFTTSPATSAYVGQSYSYTPGTSEEGTIYVDVKPSWLTYSGGVLSGAPTGTGTAQVVVRAVSGSETIHQYYNITTVNWVRHGMVMSGFYQEPSVIYEGSPKVLTNQTNVYKMWFRWTQSSEDRLGYAESADGLSWTIGNNSHPLMSQKLATPFVTKIGSTYYLYCLLYPYSNQKLGLYTSSDGLYWTTVSTNTFAISSSGWDNFELGNMQVWVEGSTWYMAYDAASTDWIWHIGLATSSDGISWTRYGSAPIVGTHGSSHSEGAADIHKIGTAYYMFWHGGETDLPTDIYVSRSTDLHTWTVGNSGNPIIARETYDEGIGNSGGQVADAAVIQVNGVTRIWWDCHHDQSAGTGIGEATYYGTIESYVSQYFDPLPPAITSTAPTTGKEGVGYEYQATCSVAVTSWSISGADFLSISSSGLVTGTPDNSDSGSYSVKVTAVTSAGTVTQPYALTIAESTTWAITSAPETAGTQGLAYSYTPICNGTATVWTLSGNATWLSIDVGTGRLSGTPMTAGSYTVTIAANTNPGCNQTYALTIAPLDWNVTVTIYASASNLKVTTSYTLSDPSLAWAVRNVTWSFGDGSDNVNGSTATHTYDKAGSYPVSCTVTNVLGANITATKTVSVKAASSSTSNSGPSSSVINGGGGGGGSSTESSGSSSKMILILPILFVLLVIALAASGGRKATKKRRRGR